MEIEKKYSLVEGNLMVVKSDTINMWEFYVMSTEGYWKRVQWMSLSNAQRFFKEELPEYREVGEVKVERI